MKKIKQFFTWLYYPFSIQAAVDDGEEYCREVYFYELGKTIQRKEQEKINNFKTFWK